MLREIPNRACKSSKRRTPRNASRTMSRLHHSPTTSRHWATEQCMSSKLVRCTGLIIPSQLPYGTHRGYCPFYVGTDGSAERGGEMRRVQLVAAFVFALATIGA